MDCSFPSSSVPGILHKNTGVDSSSFLQAIFPTQGSNLGLPCCMRILYHLNPEKPLVDLKISVIAVFSFF